MEDSSSKKNDFIKTAAHNYGTLKSFFLSYLFGQCSKLTLILNLLSLLVFFSIFLVVVSRDATIYNPRNVEMKGKVFMRHFLHLSDDIGVSCF